ncbi:EG45-like domain containing protein [Camellia lanceoleosa]|uniref:EG45-like domain containing protein n=1 Tax=Camellia lanceoleosa TaxID=1840588 RepID=A0ACC0FX51_9ERIC|nr:EG45-like domain containing protein [Camellia lanceoleosa]
MVISVQELFGKDDDREGTLLRHRRVLWFCLRICERKRVSMNPPQFVLVCLSIFLLFFTHLSLADVGTAASYAPPYIPTACSGNDGSQFPSSNLFAAAGEGIWDNGAACGTQYLVRCISAAAPNSCNSSQTIQVKIVDRAQTSASRPSRGRTTIVLSTTAFGAIANGSSPSINIEFQQV